MSQGQRVYVSKSDAPQKIERRQIDGNDQSILAEPIQREIHTRPSKAQTSLSPWHCGYHSKNKDPRHEMWFHGDSVVCGDSHIPDIGIVHTVILPLSSVNLGVIL